MPFTVLINLGIYYEDRNLFERACGCYAAVLRRDPSNPRARLYYAYVPRGYSTTALQLLYE